MGILDGWSARQINAVLRQINEEVPLEKCNVSLNDEEKKWYATALENLKKERAANPGVPIEYDMMELEWE